MPVENFTPPLAGSGGQWQTIWFTGGPAADGEGQAMNWLGFTALDGFAVSKAARLALVTLQLSPVTTFPANGTFRVRVLRNGEEMVAAPLLTGDGTGNQVEQAYVVPEGEGVLEAGDVMSPVIDVENIGANGYYTAIGLTFVHP